MGADPRPPLEGAALLKHWAVRSGAAGAKDQSGDFLDSVLGWQTTHPSLLTRNKMLPFPVTSIMKQFNNTAFQIKCAKVLGKFSNLISKHKCKDSRLQLRSTTVRYFTLQTEPVLNQKANQQGNSIYFRQRSVRASAYTPSNGEAEAEVP